MPLLLLWKGLRTGLGNEQFIFEIQSHLPAVKLVRTDIPKLPSSLKELLREPKKMFSSGTLPKMCLPREDKVGHTIWGKISRH